MDSQSVTPDAPPTTAATDKPAEKTPEQIEREMSQTRESITEKVSALETQVMDTVKNATETVSTTVEAVKNFVTAGPGAITDTVKTTLTSVSDAVKDQLDFSKRIRENPWAAIGIAAGAGFITALLTNRLGRSSGESSFRHTDIAKAVDVPTKMATESAPREPGIFDQIWHRISDEVAKLTDEAVKTASSSLRDTIQTEVPGLINSTVQTGKEAAHNRLQDRNLI
jgi:ElaB/YqjD/DUF883 family membrane-anchored ribosome-binding protein